MNECNPLWVKLLEQMTGADAKVPGSRNFFCAEVGSEDWDTMKEMCQAGLVFPGRPFNGGRDQYFHAYRNGCKYAGLSEAATRRALRELGK